MTRKNLYILTLIFCFVLAPAFYGLVSASAQSTIKPNPTPTPAASKTPPKFATPTPQPTPDEEDDGEIRIDTEIVGLSVRVIDRNNRPINNLRKEDFKVYENNVLQPIESFTTAEVPTNYALVIDNSGSLRSQLEKVIDASKVIISTNRPDDETAVIRFVSRDKIEVKQTFTSNKMDLFDALDDMYIECCQTALIDAVYLAAEMTAEYEKSGARDDRKRRALILVSDGEDRDSYYNESQLFDLLREADVQIYAIGFVAELSNDGGFISKSPQKKAKSFLERLSEETGGKAYFPTSLTELNTIAADIASELRTQYLVSYYPTNDAKDGSFRSIKVVVTEGPNKQKRIAVTRSGRKAAGGSNSTQPIKKP